MYNMLGMHVMQQICVQNGSEKQNRRCAFEDLGIYLSIILKCMLWR
jgi:hypothetical protein